MDKRKRSFLKVAGSSIIGVLGLGWVRPVTAAQVPGATRKPVEALTGKRLALAVDVKKCSLEKGCSACIDACHSRHNVPTQLQAEEEIKWIWKETYEHAFPTQAHRYTESTLKQQAVLVLCNHCENPPCVRVCPTQATWKREGDGLIMMDQHRCIGCRYCMVACPYGSRSFNWQDPRRSLGDQLNREYPTRMKGVVEKCNFCAERLVFGEEPLCVAACRSKSQALLFGDLEDPDSEISKTLKERHSIRRKPALGTEPQVYYLV
ncbi:MAG: 4Fe-4S dicluster domain-containing protein [Acidobacteriota bacterium]|nr:MAG: 4Fe-4S dicluster domain-containing protein [Acidobacteriota bacterium]